MQIGRRQFIATLAAAIVAPQLPAIEVVPLVPPITPFWSGTLPPATGVLTFEMLRKAIDDISNSIGHDRIVYLPPWYAKTIRRLELEDFVARARSAAPGPGAVDQEFADAQEPRQEREDPE